MIEPALWSPLLSAESSLGPASEIKAERSSGRGASSDFHNTIRYRALRLIFLLGPAGKDAVKPLMALWKQCVNPEELVHIAKVLGAIGPAAKEALPLLEAVVHKTPEPSAFPLTNNPLRKAAEQAVRQIKAGK